MKSRITLKRKMIRVEWQDHSSLGGWLHFDETNDWCEEDPMICVTTGWLWYENEQVLVIAQTIAENGVSGLMKIIKSDIVHRKVIK